MKDLSLLCQIGHGTDRPDFRSILVGASDFELLSSQHQSTWTFFRYRFDGVEILCSVFVRKVILSIENVPSGPMNLEQMLAFALAEKRVLTDAATRLVDIVGGDVDSSASHLLVNCGALSRVRGVNGPSSLPEWIGDGVTTFALRAFDSRSNKLGIIRVSRHLTATYDLSRDLVADVIGLIYEKILYGSYPTGSAEVFALLDALSAYVLPAELNLYLHRIAVRLAVFGVVIAGLISAVGSIQNRIADVHGSESWWGLAVLYGAFAVGSVGIWKGLGWLTARRE